jgi:hypothetical protein
LKRAVKGNIIRKKTEYIKSRLVLLPFPQAIEDRLPSLAERESLLHMHVVGTKPNPYSLP